MDAMKAQNALMEGQARFEKWQSGFQKRWAEPLQRQTLKGLFARLPADAKDELRKSNPGLYARLENFIKAEGGTR